MWAKVMPKECENLDICPENIFVPDSIPKCLKAENLTGEQVFPEMIMG